MSKNVCRAWAANSILLCLSRYNLAPAWWWKVNDSNIRNAVEQYRAYDLVCLALLLPRLSANLPCENQRTSQQAGKKLLMDSNITMES